MGEINVYKRLVRHPEGKSILEIHWRRWKDNVKSDCNEMGMVVVDLINTAQDRDRW